MVSSSTMLVITVPGLSVDAFLVLNREGTKEMKPEYVFFAPGSGGTEDAVATFYSCRTVLCVVNGSLVSFDPGASFDFVTVATGRWLSLRYPTSEAQKVPLVSPGNGLLWQCLTRPTMEVAMS